MLNLARLRFDKAPHKSMKNDDHIMRFPNYVLTTWMIFGGARAYQKNDATTLAASEPVHPITTIVPGFSYIIKLDCIGCPFPSRNESSIHQDEWEEDPRPSSLVGMPLNTSSQNSPSIRKQCYPITAQPSQM